MLLKDYIPNVNKRSKNISFSGISFESSKIKKITFFLQLKALDLMEIALYHWQLKKGLKL